MVNITPLFSISTALMFLCFTGFQTINGQSTSPSKFGTLNGYGVSGGFSVSDLDHRDSTGFSSSSLPYLGLQLSLYLTKKTTLKGGLQYASYGFARKTPYERYRYTYLNGYTALSYNITNFFSLQGGYCYSHPSGSKLVLLNGNNPSGVEKRNITGIGAFGSWTLGGAILLTPTVSMNFRYDLPSASSHLKTFQIGLEINLQKLPDKSAGKELEKKIQAGIAEEHVKSLKTGVLLVRLKSMQNTIEQLESAGFMNEAEQLRKAAEEDNTAVIKAFSHYHFSACYFFYDHHSGLVKEGKIDSILMDHQLNRVIPELFAGKIYIAEFGNYTSGESSYHVRRDIQYLKDNNIAPDSSAAWVKYGHQGLGIGGIVVMDSTFTPLDKPFPVFTPITNRTLFKSENKLEKAVQKLDEDLQSLYLTSP